MNPSEIVRAEYPEARAKKRAATYQQGMSKPYEPEEWEITATRKPSLGEKPLGVGQTEDEAWNAAVETLRRRFMADEEWFDDEAGALKRKPTTIISVATYEIIQTGKSHYQTKAEWPGRLSEFSNHVSTVGAAKELAWTFYVRYCELQAELYESSPDAQVDFR